MFSLKHVKCLSRKFQIVTAGWAAAGEEAELLVFYASFSKTPERFPFELLILLKLSKNWSPCLVTPRCTDDRVAPLLRQQLWPPSAFRTPTPRDPSDFFLRVGPLLLIIHLPWQTRCSSRSWIHSFHFTLFPSKAQIGFSNTWPPLLNHAHRVLSIPLFLLVQEFNLSCLHSRSHTKPFWCTLHTDARPFLSEGNYSSSSVWSHTLVLETMIDDSSEFPLLYLSFKTFSKLPPTFLFSLIPI